MAGPVRIFQLSVCLLTLCSVIAQEVTVEYRVEEEQDRHTYVGNIARDSLLYGNVTNEEFQRMKFQILTQGNQFAPLFQIDESASTLRTNDVLDREKICPDEHICKLSFSVAVYLKDKLTDVLDLYKIIKIVVTLEDINDNAPKFPNKEVTIPISENSPVDSEYFTNGAIDLDTGANNSVQTYRLDPPNEMFGLKVLNNADGSSDLNIVVKFPLDRETRSSYQLVVYAEDGGTPRRSGSVKINITITDQNDNSPIFSEVEYNVTVQENTPINSTIMIVTATDTDAGDNGIVEYKFSSRTSTKITDVFAINSTSGEITSKDVLDYEDNQKWTFKVEAHDKGSPPRKSTVNVIVNIADTNDNYPQININLPPGGTKISEAAEPGSFVAHVAVFDTDAVNGKIKCTVLGEDFRLEDFKIENNYKVVLNKSLDHEVKDSYEVNIQCEDGGNPPKTNATSFSVKVEDINDNFPKFSKDIYEVTIQEEVLQTIIVQVAAEDIDSGRNGEVTFGLEPDARTRFTVNPKTGLITANTKFDREVDPAVEFRVMAWDNAEIPLTSTATVSINLIDINDNAPKFPSNPVEIFFEEEVEAPQVANLGVIDPDAGPNSQFTLTFPQNDYLSEFFSFDSKTGEIRTLKKIDREKIPYFRFEVKAVDTGAPRLSSTAEVIIHIRDSNDNIPAILYPNNANKTKTVPITSPIGYLVATVMAKDKDDGVNAQLLYFIDDGDTRDIFKMDVNTGRLTVGREMSGQDADKYELDLAVRDNGKEQRTSYTTLIVTIQPANETASAMTGEDNKQNILIVVIFVVVTIVLSIAIIATIFIIRHIDRRNRPPPAPKMTENRYYETAKADESMSASSNVSKDSDTELLKKRAKKEVSFSIDEDASDHGNNSTLTNVTSFTTMKTAPSYMSMDYKVDDSQSSTWLCNNTFSSGDLTKTELYEKELSGLTHSQLQHALQHIHNHNDKLWLQPVREEEPKHLMSKKADDNHSETSHETTTSDSGRGGSEEDINSNRGHTLSDSEEGKHYNDYRRKSYRSQPEKLVPRRLPPPIPVDNSYQRNISFSDDSVTANTTVASNKFPLPSTSMASSTMLKTPLKKQQELFMISKDMFFESQMTTPGMPYSIADIEDMSEMAVTCRDDASTTTSGSYTVNPEDLCNEIDELFFKDVIV